MTAEENDWVGLDALFAKNVEHYRLRNNLSQGDLARRMNDLGFKSYSQMTVSRTEKGSRQVGVAEAHALAESLQVDFEEMTKGFRLVTLRKRVEAVVENYERTHEAIADIHAAEELLRIELEKVNPVFDLASELDKPVNDHVADELRVATRTLERTQWKSLAEAITRWTDEFDQET
ncbi:helix-turn-helix transcriptional regulator [Brevibacterium linens]|uniref:Pou domain - N-terminal to homeobox domain-containing protein n=1 Tax=Brevibacterium linens ATCC 9172 TaxID=1255617 RepID=A0A2H1KJU6_BRELN|nr:helix-turn-helix transcriptional regulator [Brevibacterium linens]KAB1943809.1 helix-turn-helix transcriptional regulator [Brevibacterium linens ATCC 9172]SMY00070.1 Pou domain - N-terminal to homeobox domain-containing protein [Brevibacterium linens ATCC 9172]